VLVHYDLQSYSTPSYFSLQPLKVPESADTGAGKASPEEAALEQEGMEAIGEMFELMNKIESMKGLLSAV
jgi:hypothetical protein